MITIETKVIGESIQLLSSPVVASKSVKSVQILFDFDDAWDGFGRIALFWSVDDEVYTSQIINGATIVPHEALDETGKIKFGVYGTNGNKRIVTVKMTYKIVEGAYSSVASESVDPSPDLIDQIETSIGKLESAINDVKNNAVRFDEDQELTDDQKAVGRGNIDAASVAAMNQALAGKVDIDQGVAQAGKALVVGADGNVVPGKVQNGFNDAFRHYLEGALRAGMFTADVSVMITRLAAAMLGVDGAVQSDDTLTVNYSLNDPEKTGTALVFS